MARAIPHGTSIETVLALLQNQTAYTLGNDDAGIERLVPFGWWNSRFCVCVRRMKFVVAQSVLHEKQSWPVHQAFELTLTSGSVLYFLRHEDAALSIHEMVTAYREELARQKEAEKEAPMSEWDKMREDIETGTKTNFPTGDFPKGKP